MTPACSARTTSTAGTSTSIVHHGAGAYICGEETALLESLEGKKGQPRLKPPFPANVGLYGCPTTVNNVESIAVAPTILRRGRRWFSGFGRPNNNGTKLFCISGHVNKPCTVEEAMCDPVPGADRKALRRHSRRLGQSAGGHSRRLVGADGARRADHATAPMDFDGAARAGFGPRHGGRDRHGQVDRHRQGDLRGCRLFLQARELRPVHAVPRRHRLDVARDGAHGAGEAQKREIDMLLEVTKQVEGHTICALGDAAAWPIQGLIRHFRPEMERRIDEYTRNAMAHGAVMEAAE